MSVTVEPWAQALGRIPSGLFIVTVRAEAGETGMLASWVQQCSFTPPRVTVAVKKGRYLLDWLKPGTALTVNVLGEGQKSLIGHFGKGFEPGEPAFEGLAVRRSTHGAAVLEEALASIETTVVMQTEVGDHVLVVAEVVNGTVHHDGRPTVHVRKNGLTY